MATGKKTLIVGAVPPDADAGDTSPTVRCWLAAVERSAGQMGLSLWPLPGAESPEWRVLAEMVAENCGCPKLLSRQDLPGADDHEEVVRLLREGHAVPEALTFPEVARELAAAYPPPSEQGLTIFFTGLSGSGKSTIANALREALIERGRRVTLLDGDLVRHHLSSELGFSREHRELNITRIGYVAAEITRHRGVAICAPIAPYEEVRARVRAMVEAAGKFVLVYVATPLDVCEGRDVKGLYAKARSGIIPNFTGVSDAYEPPASTEIVIDTAALSPAEAVETIMVWLAERGYISKRPDPGH
jgi:adenylyl-sulfate kinase